MTGLLTTLGDWASDHTGGLSLWRREGQGFLRAGKVALRDLPRAELEGIPEEHPCQPEENPVLPNSFT